MQRPTSRWSTVERDADKVASYLPTAATTGKAATAPRPPSTRRRSPGRTRAPNLASGRQRLLGGPAMMRLETTPSSTSNRVGDVVGPVHHLRFQARPLRGAPCRTHTADSRSSSGEAELPPLAAKLVTTHPRSWLDRVQGRASSSAPLSPCASTDFWLKAGQDTGSARCPRNRRGCDFIKRPLTSGSIRRVPDVMGCGLAT